MDVRELAVQKKRELKGFLTVGTKYELKDAHDLSVAYTPGVAEPCLRIKDNEAESFELTCRSNMVAVVSDGTRVLGLGDIGAAAALPVMEGKSLLFKKFGDVDCIPLVVDTKDADTLINTVKLLQKNFAGINLEDISSPKCYEIENRLKEELEIPVFHDDQHGTAVVVLAALYNALRVTKKDIKDITVVLNGPGAAGTAIIKMMHTAGVGKIIAVDLPVVGDAKQALEMLLAEPVVKNNTEKWIEKVKKDKERVRSYDKKERMVQPQAVIERIGELTDGDAVVVTDVGQHQMWTAQYYPYQNERQLVTSGGLGTMGFGVPAAIGAKIANPDKEVILFVGDGGFQMTNQELAILNVYKVPIKVVMLNNHSLGMVRQWQESFYEGRTSESVFDTLPDFQLMAQAYGIKSYKFDNPETIDQDLEVIKEDVPMFIEVDISRKEHVLPIVPAGKSNHEMLGVKFNA